MSVPEVVPAQTHDHQGISILAGKRKRTGEGDPEAPSSKKPHVEGPFAEWNTQRLCTWIARHSNLENAEQYAEAFAAKNICGRDVAILDDDVLKDDIGIPSKLERGRILQALAVLMQQSGPRADLPRRGLPLGSDKVLCEHLRATIQDRCPTIVGSIMEDHHLMVAQQQALKGCSFFVCVTSPEYFAPLKGARTSWEFFEIMARRRRGEKIKILLVSLRVAPQHFLKQLTDVRWQDAWTERLSFLSPTDVARYKEMLISPKDFEIGGQDLLCSHPDSVAKLIREILIPASNTGLLEGGLGPAPMTSTVYVSHYDGTYQRPTLLKDSEHQFCALTISGPSQYMANAGIACLLASKANADVVVAVRSPALKAGASYEARIDCCGRTDRVATALNHFESLQTAVNTQAPPQGVQPMHWHSMKVVKPKAPLAEYPSPPGRCLVYRTPNVALVPRPSDVCSYLGALGDTSLGQASFFLGMRQSARADCIELLFWVHHEVYSRAIDHFTASPNAVARALCVSEGSVCDTSTDDMLQLTERCTIIDLLRFAGDSGRISGVGLEDREKSRVQLLSKAAALDQFGAAEVLSTFSRNPSGPKEAEEEHTTDPWYRPTLTVFPDNSPIPGACQDVTGYLRVIEKRNLGENSLCQAESGEVFIKKRRQTEFTTTMVPVVGRAPLALYIASKFERDHMFHIDLGTVLTVVLLADELPTLRVRPSVASEIKPIEYSVSDKRMTGSTNYVWFDVVGGSKSLVYGIQCQKGEFLDQTQHSFLFKIKLAGTHIFEFQHHSVGTVAIKVQVQSRGTMKRQGNPHKRSQEAPQRRHAHGAERMACPHDSIPGARPTSAPLPPHGSMHSAADPHRPQFDLSRMLPPHLAMPPHARSEVGPDSRLPLLPPFHSGHAHHLALHLSHPTSLTLMPMRSSGEEGGPSPPPPPPPLDAPHFSIASHMSAPLLPHEMGPVHVPEARAATPARAPPSPPDCVSEGEGSHCGAIRDY